MKTNYINYKHLLTFVPFDIFIRLCRSDYRYFSSRFSIGSLCLFSNRRDYSTSNPHSQPQGSNVRPQPILTLDLDNKGCIKSYESILKGKGGIYSLVNTINGKRYIGSAKDLYLRLNEHLDNKKSNIALQKAFAKYGLDQFKFCIYEYFTYESKIISQKALTDLETSYIGRFNFDSLYNFKTTATSSLGYKHTEEARLKMRDYSFPKKKKKLKYN